MCVPCGRVANFPSLELLNLCVFYGFLYVLLVIYKHTCICIFLKKWISYFCFFKLTYIMKIPSFEGIIFIFGFYYVGLELSARNLCKGEWVPSAQPSSSPIQAPSGDVQLTIWDRWLLTAHLPASLITSNAHPPLAWSALTDPATH